MNDISFSSTIDDLNLCVRTVGVLRSSGIEQVADLVTLTPRKVKRLYGVGSRVLDEIERALDAHGFRLGMDVEPSATPSPLTFADVIGEHRDQFAEAERVRVAELRDHFAGLAMQAIIALDLQLNVHDQCKEAYRYADAMLAAREQRT